MRLAVAFAALLATSFAARADWEGDLVMQQRQGQGQPMGKVRFHDGKMRMEMRMGPMQMTTIADFANKRVLMINEQNKTWSETNADAASAQHMPSCASKDADKCLTEQGMKKTGEGEAQGQRCTIWEGDRKSPHGTVHQKLWRPKSAGKEFAFVRAVSKTERGEFEMDVENFKQTPQSASFFEVPSGYTKTEGMFPGMGGPGMGGPGRDGHGMRPGRHRGQRPEGSSPQGAPPQGEGEQGQKEQHEQQQLEHDQKN